MAAIGFAQMGWQSPAETDSGTAAFPFVPQLATSPATDYYHPVAVPLLTYFEWWWRVRYWTVALSTAPPFDVSMDGLDATGLQVVFTSEENLVCALNGRVISFHAVGGGGEDLVFRLDFSSPYNTLGGSAGGLAVKYSDVADTWLPQFAMHVRHVNPGLGFDYNAWSDGRAGADFTPSGLTFTFAGYNIPCYCPPAFPDFLGGSTLTIDPVIWWGYNGRWDTSTGTQLVIPMTGGL